MSHKTDEDENCETEEAKTDLFYRLLRFIQVDRKYWKFVLTKKKKKNDKIKRNDPQVFVTAMSEHVHLIPWVNC